MTPTFLVQYVLFSTRPGPRPQRSPRDGRDGHRPCLGDRERTRGRREIGAFGTTGPPSWRVPTKHLPFRRGVSTPEWSLSTSRPLPSVDQFQGFKPVTVFSPTGRGGKGQDADGTWRVSTDNLWTQDTGPTTQGLRTQVRPPVGSGHRSDGTSGEWKVSSEDT